MVSNTEKRVQVMFCLFSTMKNNSTHLNSFDKVMSNVKWTVTLFDW